MTHREIWHELHFNATPEKVYQAVTDVKKLAHWWTTDTLGKSAVGNKIEFWFFGKMLAEMIVTALKVGELVCWKVTERSIAEWVSTEIGFRIFRQKEKTILHFRHS